MRCRSPSPNGPLNADNRFSYSVSTPCRQSDWGRRAEVERAELMADALADRLTHTSLLPSSIIPLPPSF